MGIDNVEDHIDKAKKSYEGVQNLSFEYVDENSSIPTDKKFDATCATFVHPTIKSFDKLKFQLKKIYDATTDGGILVLLGLHPNSFQNCEFLFYRHKPTNGIDDGTPFANELRLANGEVIKFTDYFWTTETLSRGLQENRFSVEGFYGLTDSLEGKVGDVLRKSIQDIGLGWKDEWKAPLYQVILARKSS